MEIIDSFSGEYRWLSNFYPCDVRYQMDTYPSSEHAYQAAKTLNQDDRDHIANNLTAGQAKRYGQTVEISDNFLENKIQIMDIILTSKFIRNLDLTQKLVDTGDAHIIEGNTWNDTFWGMCDGKGKNNLGKLIMKLRRHIIEDNII